MSARVNQEPAEAGFDIQEFRDVTTADQLGTLVPGILQCMSSAFGDQGTEIDLGHHRRHIPGEQVLVAEDPAIISRVAGFSSVLVNSPREEFDDPQYTSLAGLYVSAVAVHREAQGRGLSVALDARSITYGVDERDRNFIFTRTQNPRIEKGVSRTLEEMTAARRIGGFTVTKVVKPHAYSKMLTATKPEARGLSYPELDYDNGDAYVILWDLQK